jgi:hypothetical protein
MAAVVQVGLANIAGQFGGDGGGHAQRRPWPRRPTWLAKENAIASMVVLVSPSAEQQKRLMQRRSTSGK